MILNNNNIPPGYCPPKSGSELVQRYAVEERYFPNSDLVHSDFREANLENIILHNSDLSFANFSTSRISACASSRPFGANLSNADLRGTILDGANLTGANCHNLNLEGARFSETILGYLDLSKANLQSCYAYRGCVVGIETLILTSRGLRDASQSQVREVVNFFRNIGVPNDVLDLFQRWSS